MGILNKCCGNCKHFTHESANGNGWCEENEWITECGKTCKCHELGINGWSKITLDNIDKVDCIPKDKVVIGWICNNEFRSCSLSCFWFTLKSIAQQGGFYCYVLPELSLEERL